MSGWKWTGVGRDYERIDEIKERTIHGPSPKHSACAMPKWGTFLDHSGLKWIVKQIFPPRYILLVFPSNSGSSSSGAVAG
jgi:hypothetical protein